MTKLTFLGAGSTVFAKNVLGDLLLTDATRDLTIALYDIDRKRLDESYSMVCALNRNLNENRAKVEKYLGAKNRRAALCDADFIVNAIQVGGYVPATVADFEIPKKYGLRQTIGDTHGIGGIFRALRTIPVLDEFAEEIAAVCPQALFLNYTNPMAILSGYLLRYTPVRAVGICHSVQVCSELLLQKLGIPHTPPLKEKIAGINHMGWLLELSDAAGVDLYPLIRRRANEVLEGDTNEETARDLVRLEYVRRLGYYCTESSEHNAEYSNFFLKNAHPELLERYQIPLDEYPRRCEQQIADWERDRATYLDEKITHTKSREYPSHLLEAVLTNTPYSFGGNVINRENLIEDLPKDACVEVPCIIDARGVHPQKVGKLPTQLCALISPHIYVQLLTIEAAVTKKKEAVYRAAMFDPHASSELTIDQIRALCDELLDAHKAFLPEYR